MITPWSPEIIVNENTSGVQTNPDTTTLDNGNYVVVWHDQQLNAIKYRIYDPTGNPVTDELTVNNSTAQPIESFPSIIHNGSGFVISHQSVNILTGIHTQTLTFYNFAGVETSEEVVATSSGPTAITSDLSVITFGANFGGFTLVAHDAVAEEINVYLYDQTGTQTSVVTINAGVSALTANPVAANGIGTGGIMVVWEEGNQTGFATINQTTGLVTNQGTLPGDASGGHKIIPGPSNGTFVIVYNDFGGNPLGSGENPVAILVSANGSILSGPTYIAPSGAFSQSLVEIVELQDGSGYLGLWFDSQFDVFMATTFDWYGNATSNAVPFAMDDLRNVPFGNTFDQISATLLDDGRVAVTYNTEGANGETDGIAMTIIDPRQGVIYGSTSSETLYGSAQSDIIMTSAGDDLVFGGAGNDYIYDNQSFTVSNANFFGGSGDDMLSGGAGIDTLDGGRGDDTLYGGTETDILYGGNDDDFIYGGGGDDFILRGNNGSDTLDGGAGRDFLGGGPAADEFKFSNHLDSVAGGLRDRILDFQQGVDTINVELIDADTNTGTDDAFVFIGTANFSNTAGEMRFLTTSNKTIVQMDIDGDGVADSSFELTGVYTLTATDFIL